MRQTTDPAGQPEPAGQVLADMQRWLQRAVIGLNLCPFAKAVQVKGQIHWVVSAANARAELLADLKRELLDLASADAQVRDTTLLVIPEGFGEFLEFNDLVAASDRLLAKLRLVGILQIASFHPAYEFADTPGDDITNFTNRAPYPTLHVLRESSVARAVQAFPDADAIFDNNRQTLRRLGPAGWAALDVGASAPTLRDTMGPMPDSKTGTLIEPAPGRRPER